MIHFIGCIAQDEIGRHYKNDYYTLQKRKQRIINAQNYVHEMCRPTFEYNCTK